MYATARPADNPAMNHEQLFDQAVRLAYERFNDATTDSHITGVYAVLVWHAQHGQPVTSVTVH